MRQIFTKIIISICLILLLPIILLFLNLYITLPQYNGQLYLGNNTKYGNVTIHRDQYGIPHIKANSFKDSLYGLGVVVAQDRLWSMHMKRRLAGGRLSEFGGTGTIALDKFVRSIGITRAAENQGQSLDQETGELLDSFCDGLNDMVESMLILPLEFQLTGQSFERWTRSDTYRISILNSLFLAFDFMFEPFKELVKLKYGSDFADEVFSARSAFQISNTTIMDDSDLKRSNLFKQYQRNVSFKSQDAKVPQYLYDQFVKLIQIETLENSFQAGKGSNSWVVNGNFTKSGKPILSNDPHLDNFIPSIWYQVEIIYEHEGQENYVIGSVIPGTPCILIGKSNYAAWGITNNLVDTSDLYLEEFDGKGNYLVDGKWIKMKVVEELIKVKGHDDIVLQVRSTHHGNLLENLLDFGNAKKPFDCFKGLSLSWAGLQNHDLSMKSAFGWMKAQNLEELESALKIFDGPVLNFVFATADNHIGYYSLGHIPIRNNPENIYIQDGTKSINDWVRFISPEETPRVIDPDRGFIVTANNKVASDNLVGGISLNQVISGRAVKITEYINAHIKEKKIFDVEDMKKMQLITHDVYCQKTHESMIKILETYTGQFDLDWGKLGTIKGVLENWNCDMDGTGPNAVGASVFGVFEERMLLKLFTNVSDNSYFNSRVVMNIMFDSFFFQGILYWGKGERLNEDYCVNSQTIKADSQMACIYSFLKAYEEAYDFLEGKFGKNTQKWQWGDIVVHKFMHSPFSDTPLRSIFEKIEKGYGNKRTIKVEGIHMVKNSWTSMYSQNLRTVISLDENEKSYYIIDTGASENAISQHYTDQMKLFTEGNYIEMLYGSKHLHKYQNVLQILRKQEQKQEI